MQWCAGQEWEGVGSKTWSTAPPYRLHSRCSTLCHSNTGQQTVSPIKLDREFHSAPVARWRTFLIPHIHSELPHFSSRIPSWDWKTRLNIFCSSLECCLSAGLAGVQHFWDISHKLWRAISRPAVLLNSGIQGCYYADVNTSLSACHNESTSVCGDAHNKELSTRAAHAPFFPPSSGPFSVANNSKSISPCKWFLCPAGSLIGR